MAYGAGLDYERLSDAAGTLHEGFAKIRVTVDSADGLITVVAGGRGEVLDLELDPRIYHVADADALATSIMTTIRAAYDEAVRESLDLVDTVKESSDDRLRPLLERMQDALESDRD